MKINVFINEDDELVVECLSDDGETELGRGAIDLVELLEAAVQAKAERDRIDEEHWVHAEEVKPHDEADVLVMMPRGHPGPKYIECVFTETADGNGIWSERCEDGGHKPLSVIPLLWSFRPLEQEDWDRVENPDDEGDKAP